MLRKGARVLDENGYAHENGIENSSKDEKGQCENGKKKVLEYILVLEVVADLWSLEAIDSARYNAQPTLAQYKKRSGPSATTVTIIKPMRIIPM